MKKLLVIIALLIVTIPAQAGSYAGTWPRITERRELDAIACGTLPITRTDQDHSCRTVPSWNTDNTNCYAAECRFVIAFSAAKTVWHLDGCYDAQQNFSGLIWQTLPTCTGFLCGYIGNVAWSGRNSQPALDQAMVYSYQWNDGNLASCDVTHQTVHTYQGLFYGTY